MLGGSVNAVATALVTGGTSGIGAAFVRALAARGDDVVIVARDTARMEATAAELSAKHGVRVEALTADLAKKADVDRLAARLESQDAPIELLINNAGFGLHSTLLDADYSEHERALDVMGLAVLVLGGAAGRAMKARGHGRIINVSSISAFIAQGGYSPVKAYSKVYSEGLANELHGSGVTVTALCPGWVATEFHERAEIKTSAIPSWLWVDADRLAALALADADKGKVVSIPTPLWKAGALGLTLAPRPEVPWVSRVLTRSRA